ncbi:MAG: glycosyltransferase [Candidatus Omnitrophica bacterium]|nr:glycosyltransferase [Candidatus Omnitrophota bacterium]
MSQLPLVTIVVVPRDRFYFTQESLESLLEHTDYPYHLVYVDAGSPQHIRNYLQKKSAENQFELIRSNHYLSPNRARNLGLSRVKTKYVVFLDNDVVVSPGWLTAMVDCVNETGCAAVCPLTCQDTPIHEHIHYAGGEASIEEVQKAGVTERRLVEKMYLQDKKVTQVRDQLRRVSIGFTEFHCFLVRTDVCNKVGGFDEAMTCTKEHIDFSLRVKDAGESIYFEPKSLVTFLTHFSSPALASWDVPFYMLRWSDAWEYGSLKHLSAKWRLTENSYFKDRYKNLGWRRKETIVKPLVRKIPFHYVGRVAEKILCVLEKQFNRCLTSYYSWRYG